MFASLVFLLTTTFLPASLPAGEILLSGTGDGQWRVSASGLSNVQTIDLDLRYDPLRLPAVTVTAGAMLSGVMSALNDKTPGTIRLGVVSTQPLPASGVLLTIKSTNQGAELIVENLTVKTSDSIGTPIANSVRQQLGTLSPPPLSSTENVTTTTSAQPLTTSPRRGGVVSGTVTFPAEGSPPSLEKKQPTLPTPVTEQRGGAASHNNALSVVSGPEKRFHSQEEIIAAIERLPQPWTITAIKAIFLKPSTASQVRQVPAVVLSDGKSKVSLYISKSLSQEHPTVGVRGCTIGSIWDAKEQGWEVELITQKGSWPGTAMLLGEKDLIKFPVVIVPPVKITPPEEHDSLLPSTDFDGDGRITAIDAYIFVGNVLVSETITD